MLIGGVDVANPVFLAPMAGITVAAVRRLALRLGCGLVHTEMASTTGLVYGGDRTGLVLKAAPGESPLVAQLFDGDTDRLARGAEIALAYGPFAALGINMACPMPKVCKRGAGSALMTRPDEAARMVKALLPLGLPVWPKIRLMDDDKGHGLTTVQFAERLFESGAACVALHGRTPSQRYEGMADREAVLGVARAFPGRILASGDVYDGEAVAAYMAGGAAAVLVARGIYRDPFLIGDALDRLAGGEGREAAFDERIAQMRVFIADLEKLHGQRLAVVMIKRFVGGFFRGMVGSGELRRRLGPINDWNEVERELDRWFGQIERGNDDVGIAAEFDG